MCGGANDAYAQAVTTGRARQAILRADGVERVRIGDPSGAFEDVGQELGTKADGSAPLGPSLSEMYEGHGESDPATATPLSTGFSSTTDPTSNDG